MEPLNDSNIHNAVILWNNNNKKAILKYGHISDWDVSKITVMNKLFKYMWDFNDCINNWNVSNVTNMYEMFWNATSFNQILNNWNVSNAKYMNSMFLNATSFNQNISNWNVSNVMYMNGMFQNAISFNQNISNWNVSNECNILNIFCFNTPIPFYKLKTTSFFDESYKNMDLLKRKKIFNILFYWDGRKNFIMFLKNYGYIINT